MVEVSIVLFTMVGPSIAMVKAAQWCRFHGGSCTMAFITMVEHGHAMVARTSW